VPDSKKGTIKMQTLQTENPTVQDLIDLKLRLRSTWMSGDYGTFARFMEKGAEEFFSRLNVSPQDRLLDVGCGAGQIALIAARAGISATGCDIATNWLDQAKARADAEGLNVTFEEGDAEALPYPDVSFDIVTSMFGAMFAPRPEMVASEFVRVCRPGGTIAMANWTPAGFIGQMFRTIGRFIAPSGMPSPVLWGEETIVRERFRDIGTVRCSLRMLRFEYPFPPDAVVDFFRMNYGPMLRAFGSLNESDQESLRQELTNLWAKHNQATGHSTAVDAEYLEVIAIRD
jgi:ubiquinone/menaquinone biosynthesis C-methylase UbiE